MQTTKSDNSRKQLIKNKERKNRLICKIKIFIEELIKYIKMSKFGVPVAQIKLKMGAEGVDPSLLDVSLYSHYRNI